MNIISFITLIAIPLNLAGVIPHIATMMRSRSAGGQSPIGWVIGIIVNAMFGVVNLIGLGEVVLGLGSFAMAVLCAGALACVLLLPKGQPRPEYTVDHFQEMATAELQVVRGHVDSEHRRREERNAQQDGPVTTELAVL